MESYRKSKAHPHQEGEADDDLAPMMLRDWPSVPAPCGAEVIEDDLVADAKDGFGDELVELVF